MATDVKNLSGGNTGNSENRGRITVKANRNTTQNQDVDPAVLPDYAISDFDAAQANLGNRLDDPRYYQGDAAT